MYYGRHAVLLGICFLNWSNWTRFGSLSLYRPFAIRCSGQCSLIHTLDIPRAGYGMGDSHSAEALQCLAYICQKRNNIYAGNGREVHLPRVPNVKVDGYCAGIREVFEYLWCFWPPK